MNDIKVELTFNLLIQTINRYNIVVQKQTTKLLLNMFLVIFHQISSFRVPLSRKDMDEDYMSKKAQTYLFKKQVGLSIGQLLIMRENKGFLSAS